MKTTPTDKTVDCLVSFWHSAAEIWLRCRRRKYLRYALFGGMSDFWSKLRMKRKHQRSMKTDVNAQSESDGEPFQVAAFLAE